MVSADLIHNPYLLQTSVKFNGQAPKINSQIEKYEAMLLKDWVDKVPEIFYNEMNGFDFDLNFSGTKSDFESLEVALQVAGVSPEEVRLFLKNELADADTKSQAVDELIQWLKDTPNRRFDFEAFCAKNALLFEGSYPYIILGGNFSGEFSSDITVEAISTAEELKSTLLTNTPILFSIDKTTIKQFRANLLTILSRKDVQQNQLFFLIHPQLDSDQVTRVICDLGVDDPQIVTSHCDERIHAYIRNYPVTDFVREAINVFDDTASALSCVLEEENKKSEAVNAEIHAEIDLFEHNLEKLKSADKSFTDRDNYNVPSSFLDLQAVLINKIKSWRIRKTKVTGDYESEAAAKECDADMQRYLMEFSSAMTTAFKAAGANVFQALRNNYMSQGLDTGYLPESYALATLPACQHVSLVECLLDQKVITYADPKTDFFNAFLGTSAKENREPVRVVTCYYEQWRHTAETSIKEITTQYIFEATQALRAYYDSLSEAFHLHLTTLIKEQSDAKDRVTLQLSDDEQKLQEDNDWLCSFMEKLDHLKRG